MPSVPPDCDDHDGNLRQNQYGRPNQYSGRHLGVIGNNLEQDRNGHYTSS